MTNSSGTNPTGPEIPETVASEVIFEHKIIELARDTVRFSDGHEAERVVVRHPGAVALIAIDEDGRWLLVRQYRHPTGKALLEIPAGTREPNERAESTAGRELREETGYAASSIIHLGGAWMAPGIFGEFMEFYVANDLKESPLPQDDDEYIGQPERMTEEEIETAIRAGEISDAKTIMALTLFRIHRAH